MNADPHDLRKSAMERDMISQAEDKEYLAMFGKACYEGHPDFKKPRWGNRRIAWANLSQNEQVAWVARAQAVLDEARKAGWF